MSFKSGILKNLKKSSAEAVQEVIIEPSAEAASRTAVKIEAQPAVRKQEEKILAAQIAKLSVEITRLRSAIDEFKELLRFDLPKTLKSLAPGEIEPINIFHTVSANSQENAQWEMESRVKIHKILVFFPPGSQGELQITFKINNNPIFTRLGEANTYDVIGDGNVIEFPINRIFNKGTLLTVNFKNVGAVDHSGFVFLFIERL